MVKSFGHFIPEMKYLAIGFIFLSSIAFGQETERPYRGGFVTKDTAELNKTFKIFYRFLGVKKNEHVASVGAQNGYVEVQLSALIDSIHWTLQEIDTSYLNKVNFEKVLSHHEKIKGSPIIGDFNLVIGTATKTNLLKNAYDRILLVNVYHELTDRKNMMLDILESLKPDGKLVIMEWTAKKKGQHRDCKFPSLWEPDFLDEIRSWGYVMVNKVTPNNKTRLTFYTLNKTQRATQ